MADGKLTSQFNSIMGQFFPKHIFPLKVLMLGLTDAGKTTIVYKFKLNETIGTKPTINHNMETLEYGSLSITLWDIGGQSPIRPWWRHYFAATDAVIYVVDSSDLESLDTSRVELHKAVNDPLLENCPVLIFVNKQDRPNALTPAQVTERLELAKLSNRKWYVQGCEAITGTGLYEGLEWVASTLSFT